MAGEDGKVDHPRRSGRLKAQTRADQEHGAEDTSEVDCSRRRCLRPQSSSGQEVDGEADHPRYNLRLRSHCAVSKEGKDHNRVKKPKHEFFLYIDYYREKEKANGRKLNARDASKQAKWMWKKMSDAVPNFSDPSWLQDLPAPPQEPVFSFSGSSMDPVSMYVSTGPEASSDSKSLFKKGKGDGVRPSPPSVNRPAVRRGSK
ncbi:hypothetical protein VPH35_064136 [Triticum aestivum]|uniref:uncharacterized protein isoform X3 n=1 Tax=Triticum aestivum TaxID=4565 RepID=UPI0008449811|nr:uncharacterized protein LOC123084671 isoform X3 [Triticum aestivum]XP_044362089.1 uncharacterized protein LOC123084671 isoform X3 [Triticum aestivum]